MEIARNLLASQPFWCKSRRGELKNAMSLRLSLVLGSTRTAGPPEPANVGRRVGAFIHQVLKARGHEVDVVDPLVDELPLLNRPHFSYGSAPEVMEKLHQCFKKADGYVMVTPEYNHSASPALMNTLNHFGASSFAFKPSGIVSYSAGQWGGARAAHALRPFLSELGCLPVSAMVHVPKAHEVFDQDSTPNEAAARWEAYASRMISQVEWWALAARNHRQVVDPFQKSPPFQRTPQQRNAA